MTTCIDNGKMNNPDEPEVRVMVICHSTFIQKFKEVLRVFQQEQTDYKNAVQRKIKRQIMIIKPDADEGEVSELANDPEATRVLLAE